MSKLYPATHVSILISHFPSDKSNTYEPAEIITEISTGSRSEGAVEESTVGLGVDQYGSHFLFSSTKGRMSVSSFDGVLPSYIPQSMTTNDIANTLRHLADSLDGGCIDGEWGD